MSLLTHIDLIRDIAEKEKVTNFSIDAAKLQTSPRHPNTSPSGGHSTESWGASEHVADPGKHFAATVICY